MASRFSVVRVARQLNAPCTRRSSAFVTPPWQWSQLSHLPQRRLASVSASGEKKYTEDHEWVQSSEDGKTYTLGISTWAASALGDVVYVELPEVDLEVSAGEAIGAVESVKSASDILTPVSGTVVEVNKLLEEKPAQLNKDPEGEAWVAKIRVEGEPEGRLMSTEEYAKFTEDP